MSKLTISQLLKFAQDFESYVYEDAQLDNHQRDHEHHMNDWMDEFQNADWNECWAEQNKLKGIISEYMAEEQDPPFILLQKIKFLNKRIKDIDDERDHSINNPRTPSMLQQRKIK